MSPTARSGASTLREGLEFSDGKPVTSEDVVASLKRWASRDTFGDQLAKAIGQYETPDARTFVLRLKSPFGLVTEALGKPSSNVPFIMPSRRVADTPGDVQVKETIGSGPYLFKADEFRPGEKAVFVKNTRYKPRAEPPSGTAGGKNVYVDRVEWLFIRDAQTQLNALLNGEADILEQPAFEQYAVLRANPQIALVDAQPAGNQFILRFNFLHAPFNNEKIRRAAMLALGQEAFLRTQVARPASRASARACSPAARRSSRTRRRIHRHRQPAEGPRPAGRAGYKGEPVVLMRPAENGTIGKLPLVAKQQLEQAGFKVDLQNMDWQTLVSRRARKDAPTAGGWSAFLTAWTASDILNPITMSMMNATGDKGWFGWQDDPTLEAIKKQFATAATDADKKKFAEAAQLRAFETVTHVPWASSASRRRCARA